MLSTSKAKSSFILHLCVQCSYIYNNNIGTLKWNYTLTFYLPYRQFAFTFALVDFRCNHITCKPKIGYFTCMIISYQYISGCQITMNYLRTRERKKEKWAKNNDSGNVKKDCDDWVEITYHYTQTQYMHRHRHTTIWRIVVAEVGGDTECAFFILVSLLSRQNAITFARIVMLKI